MDRNLRKRRKPSEIVSESVDECLDESVEESVDDSFDASFKISSDEDFIPEDEYDSGELKKRKLLAKKNDASTKGKRKKTDEVSTTKKKEKKTTSTNSEKTKKKINNNDILDIDVSSVASNLSSNEFREWSEIEYVSELNNVEAHIARNVVNLFNEENTIPFIARYRKNLTGGMEPDKLRSLKESYEQAQAIKQRARAILKIIDKLEKWTPNVYSTIMSLKSLQDLEHVYSFYRPATKRSLAEKARELGLSSITNKLVEGKPLPALTSLINPGKKGLETEQQIKDGIIHIIADIINKDKAIFDKVCLLQEKSFIQIQTTECKVKKSPDEKAKDSDGKYTLYYNFTIDIKNIKPHQTLAINRAEAQKIITVKIILQKNFEENFTRICTQQYKNALMASKLHSSLFMDSVNYSYMKFIKPLVTRRVRSEMKQNAEVASIEVFATNVKQLLLGAPVRGKVILGIDPGFRHGCKLAVISNQGNVLETGVIYPHNKSNTSYYKSAQILSDLIMRHRCTILALGNATACRETESFLQKVITSEELKFMNLSYAIVDEAGASIYSCSTEAKNEFSDLDPNIISAISIARRLQDPLAELVKIEPKHLGVGMYQHDLPEKQLLQTLNEVVSEAVSFVGVDVNTASSCLLKRVAGLNESKANKIIEWRTMHGPFRNRKQLLDVKGIGSKTFEQCAGFMRVLPETFKEADFGKKTQQKDIVINLLDQTWIHPESYEIAEEFLTHCNCNIEDLGKSSFIQKIKSNAEIGFNVLAEKLDTDETTIEIIVKGLSMKKDEDIRVKADYPLFRNSMLDFDDLSVGITLTGAVRNVTHFGAFVDVGVGTNGLIPNKFMKNKVLSIGQRIEVKVISIEKERARIALELVKVF